MPRKPSNPWKRGPTAWRVAENSEHIQARLGESPRSVVSLRQAAQMLGVSTQPLRHWVRDGWLTSSSKRLSFSIAELSTFVLWLERCAKPYDMQSRIRRFRCRGQPAPGPFVKLREASFVWPKECKALRPRELAALIGCHTSHIVSAIQEEVVRGDRPTPCRWEITRLAWACAFPGTLKSK